MGNFDRSASMSAKGKGVDRRQQLEMKRKLEQLKAKINDVKGKLEQGEVALSEIRALSKTQDFKMTTESNAQEAQLNELQRWLESMGDRETEIDGRIDVQNEELRSLENVVDQLKLKFIHAFLTNSYDVGTKVEPESVFNQASMLPDVEFDAPPPEPVYSKPIPNIVTPILAELRGQLSELLRSSVVDIICSNRPTAAGADELKLDSAEEAFLAELQQKGSNTMPSDDEECEEGEEDLSDASVNTEDLFN